MTKKSWFLFAILLVIIAILSSTSSFFYLKSKSSPTVAPTEVPEAEIAAANISPSATATPTSKVSAAAVSSPSNRPSSPTDTYTIQKGDSLLAIATENGLTASELSAANGITDANKIQAGQVVIIPKAGVISYTVDETRVANLEKAIANGKYAFRLDPVETAKADTNPAFSLQSSDTYVIASKDDQAGKAIVNATHETLKYTISLTQPATKGPKGLWAITSIKEAK